MKTVSISVDVWCDYDDIIKPAYRVYVDSDMLTERTFIWKSASQYIREHIEVNLAPGSHWLTIENLTPETAVYRIENMQADGVPITAASGTRANFHV
jgi:hypothetical protein